MPLQSVAYGDRVPRATNSNPGRRILVYGVTGSGKSTAAQRIAARTRLPLTLADELTWTPGWFPVAEDEQRWCFAAVAAQDRWVLDTAYGAWLDVVLPRVDLVVGLDYPRWFSLQRVFRRSVMRAIDKKPICNGNTESFRGMVGRDSLIGWHWRSCGSPGQETLRYGSKPSVIARRRERRHRGSTTVRRPVSGWSLDGQRTLSAGTYAFHDSAFRRREVGLRLHERDRLSDFGRRTRGGGALHVIRGPQGRHR